MYLSALSLALNRPGAVSAVLTPEQQVAALFANNEQGAWYDPSDYSTMFQAWGGTTAVTNVEQPVGLLLDKRKGLALETALDTSFTNGWSAVAGGTVTDSDTFTCASVGGITKSFLTVGKVYKLTFSYVKTGLVTQFSINNESHPTRTLYAATAAAGSGTIYFYAQDTSIYFRCSAADTIDVTWSIQAVQGNHAYQTGSTARPVLRARYNLLTYSEQFDNAIWNKQNATVTSNQGTAPDGTNTIDKVVFSGGTAAYERAVYLSGPSIPSGTSITFSIYAKGENGGESLEITNRWGGGGVVTLTTTMTRYSFTFAANANSNNFYIQSPNNNTTVYIWGAQEVVGTSAGDYQRIAASTDYATVSTITSVAFKPYLDFDGGDHLETATFDTPTTSVATVWTGAELRSVGMFRFIAEYGPTVSTTNNTFALVSNATSAPSGIYLPVRGTAVAEAVSANYSPPWTKIITGQLDTTAASAAAATTLRTNGALDEASTTGSAPAGGNWSAQKLYVGRRITSTQFFDGKVWGYILRMAATDAAQVTTGETYMAAKTGVTL